MNILKSTILAGVVSLVAPAAMAASILIDSFDSFQGVSAAPDTYPLNSTLADASVLGGHREMTVTTSASAPGNEAATTMFSDSGTYPSELRFSNGSGVTGTGELMYDAAGAGLGGTDLTMGGVLDRFYFDVVDFDISDAGTFTTLVCDTTGNCREYVETINFGFDPFLNFNDAAWVEQQVGVTNFGSVASLTFTFESTVGSFDAGLASISVVPLPASALLLLGGLGGFGGLAAVRRRRRST